MLVVDDDSAIRSLIGITLSLEGVAVYMAANGAEALIHFRDSRIDFDLVLLDLSMPVMDGRAFFARMQADHPSPPPVLLLSAYGAQSAQRELGAASWMDKPFEVDALLARVLEFRQS